MKLSPATGVVLLATVGLLVLAFDLRHERDLLITEFEAEREVGWPFHSQFWEPHFAFASTACGPSCGQVRVARTSTPGVKKRS